MSDAPIPDIEARLIGISRNGVSNQAGESLSEIHSTLLQFSSHRLSKYAVCSALTN